MTDLLEELAKEHFKEGNPNNLLKGIYDQVTDENLIKHFGTENPLIKRRLVRRIEQRLKENPASIQSALQDKPNIQEGILTSLSYIDLQHNALLLPSVVDCLEHGEENVQLAAAQVISYQYPEEAMRLERLFATQGDEAARIMVYSGEQELIYPLLRFYGFPEKGVPPHVGFLLTPEWLAEEYENNPTSIQKLIAEFGYTRTDEEQRPLITADTLPLLAEGLRFTDDMMAIDNVAQYIDRIQEFSFQLLPAALEMNMNYLPLNPDDPLDKALFLAAVRQSDVENITAKKIRNPFSYRNMDWQMPALCLHAPYRYYHRILIEEGEKLAEFLQAKDRGTFLLERAKTMLESEEEQETEAELMLMSMWKGKIDARPRKYPVETYEDFPEGKLTVIRESELPPRDERLSPGAQSVVNLQSYFDMEKAHDLADKLAIIEAETELLPIGCEIQMPVTKQTTAFGWKQALRFFGVPSPRRPEFKRTVEAAFRPASTYHGLALGPLLIEQLGMFTHRQDMAFHISIEGDLGDDVRYIAFPAQFMKRSRKRRNTQEQRFSGMSRLMSKGFVNMNGDVEQCNGTVPQCRTELRVFGCYLDGAADEDGEPLRYIDEGDYEGTDGQVKLRLNYIDDLISTQLLATASQRPHLKDIWGDYCQAIEDYTARLDPLFKELLDSNWYERTGDPIDWKLVGYLPIIQAREKLIEIMKDQEDFKNQLETDFHEIRKKYVLRIHDKLAKPDVEMNGVSEYGIPHITP